MAFARRAKWAATLLAAIIAGVFLLGLLGGVLGTSVAQTAVAGTTAKELQAALHSTSVRKAQAYEESPRVRVDVDLGKAGKGRALFEDRPQEKKEATAGRAWWRYVQQLGGWESFMNTVVATKSRIHYHAAKPHYPRAPTTPNVRDLENRLALTVRQKGGGSSELSSEEQNFVRGSGESSWFFGQTPKSAESASEFRKVIDDEIQQMVDARLHGRGFLRGVKLPQQPLAKLRSLVVQNPGALLSSEREEDALEMQIDIGDGLLADTGFSAHNVTLDPGFWGVFVSRCGEKCAEFGTCNEELGRCECPWDRAGNDCLEMAMPECRVSENLTTACNQPGTCACHLRCEQFGFGHNHACFDIEPPYKSEESIWAARQVVMQTDGRGRELSVQRTALSENDRNYLNILPSHLCPLWCSHVGWCEKDSAAASGGLTGQCRCPPGFAGPGCELQEKRRDIRISCLNDCSGRGKCNRGFCHCKAGAFGIDCSLSLGPKSGEANLIFVQPGTLLETGSEARQRVQKEEESWVYTYDDTRRPIFMFKKQHRLEKEEAGFANPLFKPSFLVTEKTLPLGTKRAIGTVKPGLVKTEPTRKSELQQSRGQESRPNATPAVQRSAEVLAQNESTPIVQAKSDEKGRLGEESGQEGGLVNPDGKRRQTEEPDNELSQTITTIENENTEGGAKNEEERDDDGDSVEEAQQTNSLEGSGNSMLPNINGQTLENINEGVTQERGESENDERMLNEGLQAGGENFEGAEEGVLEYNKLKYDEDMEKENSGGVPDDEVPEGGVLMTDSEELLSRSQVDEAGALSAENPQEEGSVEIEQENGDHQVKSKDGVTSLGSEERLVESREMGSEAGKNSDHEVLQEEGSLQQEQRETKTEEKLTVVEDSKGDSEANEERERGENGKEFETRRILRRGLRQQSYRSYHVPQGTSKEGFNLNPIVEDVRSFEPFNTLPPDQKIVGEGQLEAVLKAVMKPDPTVAPRTKSPVLNMTSFMPYPTFTPYPTRSQKENDEFYVNITLSNLIRQEENRYKTLKQAYPNNTLYWKPLEVNVTRLRQTAEAQLRMMKQSAAMQEQMRKAKLKQQQDFIDSLAHVRNKTRNRGAAQPLIYVYELPPHLNTWTYVHGAGADRTAPVIFLEKLLHSPHRTTDSRLANFFFVPAWPRWHLNRGPYLESVVQFVNSTWPFFNRNQGRDHIWFTTDDWGPCEETGFRNLVIGSGILLTFWGYTKNAHNGEEQACYIPGQDIVMPPNLEFDVLQKRMEVERSGALHAGIQHRPTWFYFAGSSGRLAESTGNARTEYSFGVRQAVFDEFEDDVRFKLEEFGREPIDYLFEMSRSVFCLAPSGHGWGTRATQAVIFGCIPVVIQDNVTQPFEYDLIDWETFGVRIANADVPRIPQILGAISVDVIERKQRIMAEVWPRFLWQSQSEGPLEIIPPGAIKTRLEDLLAQRDAFATTMEVLRQRLQLQD